jgi:hypothetical protein
VNKHELAELEKRSIERALKRARLEVVRLMSALENHHPWSPPVDLPRNKDGVLTYEVEDPFKVGGYARGTRYERLFDLAAVGATELGEPFCVTCKDMNISITASPGQSPEELRSQGTRLGEWISRGV